MLLTWRCRRAHVDLLVKTQRALFACTYAPGLVSSLFVYTNLITISNSQVSKAVHAWKANLISKKHPKIAASAMLIDPPTGPSSKNTLHDTSYGHSHHSHFRKHTPNTCGRLRTSIFDSEHFSATSNISEVFRNTPNARGRSHPTPPTFGHISCTFPT
jgi:hypothetical protein